MTVGDVEGSLQSIEVIIIESNVLDTEVAIHNLNCELLILDPLDVF